MNHLTRVAVCAVAFTVAIGGCTSDDPPSAGNSVPPTVTPAGDRPWAWETSLYDAGKFENATVVGDTVVVQADRQVVALNRSNGKQLWQLPVKVDVRVSVTQQSVVVEQRDSIRGVDLRTGQVRYRAARSDSLPNAAVTAGWVMVPACPTGSQTCTVTGLQLPTFTKRWSFEFRRPARVVSVEAPGSNLLRHHDHLTEPNTVRASDLVVLSQATDRDRLLTALRSTSGKPGRTFPARENEEFELVSGHIGLSWNSVSDAECLAKLAAQDMLTGRQLWDRALYRWGCRGKPRYPLVNGTVLAAMTPDREPVLIELATGRTLWTGEQDTVPIGFSGRTVIAQTAQTADATEPYSLVSLDAADGRERWRVEVGGSTGEQLVEAAVYGDRTVEVVSTDPRRVLRVRDAITGQPLWIAEGSNNLLGAGDGWVITDAGTQSIRMFRSR